MIKKSVVVLLALGTILFTGCANSKSNNTKNTRAFVQDDGTRYICNTEDSYLSCTAGDCSSCKKDEPQEVSPTKAICTVEGDTILVDEGTTCTNGYDTLTCKDNSVSRNGSVKTKILNLNGKKYICQ